MSAVSRIPEGVSAIIANHNGGSHLETCLRNLGRIAAEDREQRAADGLREIIVKRGTEITAYELTGETMGGDGERLGTAYRLANGQIIYVPD